MRLNIREHLPPTPTQTTPVVCVHRSQIRGQPRREKTPGEEVVAMPAVPGQQLRPAVQPQEEEEGGGQEDPRGEGSALTAQTQQGFINPGGTGHPLLSSQWKIIRGIGLSIKQDSIVQQYS